MDPVGFYRSVLESLPDLSVFVVDSELRYRVVAGAALSKFHWRAGELIGRRPGEVLPGGDGAALEDHVRAALAGEVRHHEHAGIRDDSAWWTSTIAPLGDPEGHVLAALILSRDVGEARRNAIERRQSEERSAMALAAAPVQVFTQDRELRFTYVSKPLLHDNPDDILRRTDHDILPAEAAERTTKAKRAALEGGGAQRLMLEVPSPNGPRSFDMTV